MIHSPILRSAIDEKEGFIPSRVVLGDARRTMTRRGASVHEKIYLHNNQ